MAVSLVSWLLMRANAGCIGSAPIWLWLLYFATVSRGLQDSNNVIFCGRNSKKVTDELRGRR
ncbi:MAG: hypothetical protein KDA89_00095 [Planctomycetaceae bacterium]|nr:hypothetical protein [Planctomycetaceae bacterium]